MKKLLASAFILGLFLVTMTSRQAKAQDVTVSFQVFYDNLSPYGQWIYDPEYGNVWVPNEEEDFRPYGSRGRWAYTDYGNTWVSEDPWGWACYHYGRWTYNPYYGWVWIPGYEWAPAWVTWRYGGGYCGWAPLGPGLTLSMGYTCPESWWVFVGPQYMYRNNCIRYWRGPSYNTTYIHQTTVINNYYVDNSTRVRYNYGPRRDVIERDTHQPIQVYKVARTNRPGATNISNNAVQLYRPRVDRNTVSQARPGNVMQAPRQVGRPQQANNITPGRTPQFRQEHRNNAIQAPNRGGNQPQQGRPDMRGNQQPQQGRPDMRGNQQPQQGRPDMRGNQQPQQGRPEPQRGRPDWNQPQQGRPQQPQPQQQGRPEPQRGRPDWNQPQQGRPQQPQPQQQGRPEPQRGRPDWNQPQQGRPQQPQPQQQGRPEPQRGRPEWNQPQQGRPQPQPQPQQQPQRPQPQPQYRPQPQPQQPQRPQPQPQYRPQPQPQQGPPQRGQQGPPQHNEQHGGGRR